MVISDKFILNYGIKTIKSLEFVPFSRRFSLSVIIFFCI